MRVEFTKNGLNITIFSIIILILAVSLQSFIFLILGLSLATYLLTVSLFVASQEKPQLDLQFSPRHFQVYRYEVELINIKVYNRSNSEVPFITLEVGHSVNLKLVGAPSVISFGLKAGEELELNLPILPTERGKHQFGPLRLSISDYLGIFKTKISEYDPITLRIFPARVTRRVNPLRAKQVFSQLIGVYAQRRKGISNKFQSLREYVRGDPSKIISWAATAKLNKLISKEFEDERELEVVIALQGGASMKGKLFDFALGSVTDIYEPILREGHSVGFLYFDKVVKNYFEPSLNKRQLMQIWGEIYDLEVNDDYANYSQLQQFILRKKITNKLIIIIGNNSSPLIEIRDSLKKMILQKNSVLFIDLWNYGFSYKEPIADLAKFYAGSDYESFVSNILDPALDFEEIFESAKFKAELRKLNVGYAFVSGPKDTVVDAIERAIRTLSRTGHQLVRV